MAREDAIEVVNYLKETVFQGESDYKQAIETLLFELEKDDDMINKLIFYIATKENKEFEDVEDELLGNFKE